MNLPNLLPKSIEYSHRNRGSRIIRTFDHKILVIQSKYFLCGLASGKPVFIRPTHINAALRDAARHVYNIKDEEALSSFSSHSIRVAGISKMHIKFALRWKSDTFLHILAQLAALTPQLCISTRTSLLSFPTASAAKIRYPRLSNFLFLTSFLHNGLHLLTISELNAPIL